MGIRLTSTRSPEHAGAETCAHDAAALIGVELEHIADQQNQDRNEEKKRHDRQAGEDDDLLGGGGLGKLRIEGVEGGESHEEDEQGRTQGGDPDLSPVRGCGHGGALLSHLIIGVGGLFFAQSSAADRVRRASPRLATRASAPQPLHRRSGLR